MHAVANMFTSFRITNCEKTCTLQGQSREKVPSQILAKLNPISTSGLGYLILPDGCGCRCGWIFNSDQYDLFLDFQINQIIQLLKNFSMF